MIEYLKKLFRMLFGLEKIEASTADDTQKPLSPSSPGSTALDIQTETGNTNHDHRNSVNNLIAGDKPATKIDTPRTQKEENDNKTIKGNGKSVSEPLPPYENTKKSGKVPRDIGGRRQVSSHKSENQSRSANSRTSAPRPELICRKHPGRPWEIVLRTPDGCEIKAVRQNNALLQATNGMYCIPSFEENIIIDYGDRKSDITLFNGEAPLIFKLPKGEQRYGRNGRRVRGITKGNFIALTPNGWTRTGHIPVEAESCLDSKFSAHYFFVGKEDTEDEIGGFEECSTLTTTRFSLSGMQLEDDSDQGDLFIGSPPKLEADSNIVWIRVGKESSDDWRGENFTPGTSLEDVLNGRQGHFYIRVYDENQMVDSGEFRYSANLQKILVNGTPYEEGMLLTPPLTGHKPASIMFVSTERKNAIHPVLVGPHPYATIESAGTITVQAHPDGDEVKCTLDAETDDIEITIKLPRIWWKITTADNNNEALHDVPLPMTREEFSECAYSSEGIIKFKVPIHVRSVHAGFGNKLGQELQIADGLLLKNFVSYREIEESSSKDTFLQIGLSETQVPIIRILPDSPPSLLPAWDKTLPPHLKSRRANYNTSSTGEPGIKTLRPQVKSKCAGWRLGKGFSLKELQNAGLTEQHAELMHCAIDKQRRSSHDTNVKVLLKRVKDYA